MIEISLKELNGSIQSLTSAAASLTAGKMKYRFAKLLNAANKEIELLGAAMSEMAKRRGAQMIGGNNFQFNPEKQQAEMIAFNLEADELMRNEMVELFFKPEFFTFSEIVKAEDPKIPISAAVLANLLWLVSDAELDAELETVQPKAAAAASA